MKDVKEAILEQTDGGFDIYKSIFPNLQRVSENKCKPVLNHFRGEKNPSLSISKYKDRWRHYDFADPELKGDAFTMYADSKNLDVKKEFLKMCNLLIGEYGIDIPEINSIASQNKIEETEIKNDKDFQVKKRRFKKLTKAEQEFLKRNRISVKTLKRNSIAFISSYKFRAQNGKCYKIKSTESSIVIGHFFKDSVKIYRPNEKTFKHQFLGGMPSGYFFGKESLERLEDHISSCSVFQDRKFKIVLASGIKDSLCLESMGIPTFCLNSETTTFIPPKIFESIKEMNKHLETPIEIQIVYDLDSTGQKMSQIISEKLSDYKIKNNIIKLPEKLSRLNGKDVADWVNYNLPNDELIDSIVGEDFDFEAHQSIEKLIPSISPISPVSSNENAVIGNRKIRRMAAKYPLKKKNSRLSKLKTKKKESKTLSDLAESKTISKEEIEETGDEIFCNLPKFFKKSLSPFKERDRFMMLLSFLVSTGSILQNVEGRFRNSKINTNLYVVIIAPPASGKSQIKWAYQLIIPIEKQLHRKSKEALMEYGKLLDLYNKGEISKEELGEKPSYVVLLLPPDITSAMLIKQLEENGGRGFMFDTEIDGLVNSNSGILRAFTDILRKASEGEPIQYFRKTDNERRYIENPILSLLISGTPEQFSRLIQDAENGLFSRIITYNFKGNGEWIDAYDPSPFDYESHFDELSQFILELYNVLEAFEESPIQFTLSKIQLIKLDELFKERLGEATDITGDDGRASIFRLAGITVRIAMILSIIERFEENKLNNDIVCNDKIFETALAISGELVPHIIESIQRMNNLRVENCYRGKKLDYFYALPDTFSYSDSQTIAEDEGIKLRTAQKWLYQFRDKGFLMNPVKGEFKKIG